MSTDVQTPVDVDTAATPAPAPARRSRQFLVGAAVGGLCGALIASAAVLAFHDDGGGTKTVVSGSDTPVITRGSSTFGSGGDVAGIVARVEPAVVAITTDISGPGGFQGQAAGSGFIISPDGYVVTNNHVVQGADTIEVALGDGDTLDADVVGRDTAADLAVVKVDGDGLPVVELGDSDAVQVGDEVVAIGNAFALEGGLTVTRGIISGPPRQIDTDVGTQLDGALQTDAAINSGNSGGPLVNADGKVIGINTASADPTVAENIGFAIPMSTARPIIESLRNGEKPAFLGVFTDSAGGDGARVDDVTDGSPADDAGIRAGDVITKIGGDGISSPEDVSAAVRRHKPGDEVEVVFTRDGDEHTVTVTLVERPDSS